MERLRGLSHAGQFPGKIALLMQRGRSLGTERLERIRDEVAAKATEFTKEQRIEITHALDNGMNFPHDPHMQDGLDFIKGHSDRMWDEEIDFGVRNANDKYYQTIPSYGIGAEQLLI